MIIKFFDQGTGRAGPIIDYLFNEEKHKSYKPELVSGNTELTKSIIDSTNRKHKYSTGAISFREGETLTELQQLELIHKFERTFAPFDEESRINFLWVRHMDKGRLELHFLTPMTDLKTNLSYNISPPGKANQNFYKAFQDIKNYEFGFKSVMHKDRKLKQNEFKQLVREATSYYEKRKEYISQRYDSPKNYKEKKNGQYKTKRSAIQSRVKNISIANNYFINGPKTYINRTNKYAGNGATVSRTARDRSLNEKDRNPQQQIDPVRKLFESNSRGFFTGRGLFGRNGFEQGQIETNTEFNQIKSNYKAEIIGMSLDDRITYLVKKLSGASIAETRDIYFELAQIQVKKNNVIPPKFK